MAEGIHDSTLAYAEYLATLSNDEERTLAQRQVKQLVLAQLPDEEVGKAPVRNLGEYLDDKIENPPALVEPVLFRGALTVMSSRAGKGKTALSLNRLVRWGMGQPLFEGIDTPVDNEPVRSLIIENEGAPSHFQDILSKIVYKGEYEPEQIELARENVHVWGDGGWSGLKLDSPENVELVRRAVGETGAQVLFLEPFRGLWRGDEKDEAAMGDVLDAISSIANEHQCAALLTHHERKSGVGEDGEGMSALRGSTVFEGHAGVMERWNPAKGGRQRELTQTKNRFRQLPAPWRAEWDDERWGYALVAEEAGESDILRLCSQFPDQYLTLNFMKDELEEPIHRLRKWANALADDGRLRRRTLEANKAGYALASDEESGSSALAI